MNIRKLLTLIACLLLPLLVGGISGYITASEIPGWYQTLNKPSFNPPNFLFGPVWTTLYILMGVSLYMVIRSDNSSKRSAMVVFAVQLILNFFWSIIFFSMHNISFALLEISTMWAGILAMIISFYRISKTAALLQVPYLLWVTFATVLNAAILYLN